LFALDATEAHLSQLDQALGDLAGDPRLVAVGEIGIDGFVPWLQTPATMLSDITNFVLLLFPSMLALLHGLCLLLPTCAYLVRRCLHGVGAVDIDTDNPAWVLDFGTGNGVGLHILLVLAAAAVMANVFGALHFVLTHAHEWRVQNTAIRVT
jgi:hypothetical protein